LMAERFSILKSLQIAAFIFYYAALRVLFIPYPINKSATIEVI